MYASGQEAYQSRKEGWGIYDNMESSYLLMSVVRELIAVGAAVAISKLNATLRIMI